LKEIQEKRLAIWHQYDKGLRPLAEAGYLSLPQIPSYATNNAHLFYVVCRSLDERQALIEFLKAAGIGAVFHYQALHQSPYYRDKHDQRELAHCDHYTNCLLRLPLFCGLLPEQVEYIIHQVTCFYD
jgi:dTDP-4-amino-4,6-dideoxygalactose transaminase